MSVLFTPYRVGSLELRNRIVIAPMCVMLSPAFCGSPRGSAWPDTCSCPP